MKRQVVLTGVTQASVAVTTFVQYALISRAWGVNALAEYSQIMRTRGVLEWIVLLMLPVAVTRLLAMKLGSADGADRRQLIHIAGAITLLNVVVCSAVLLAWPRECASILFGRADMADWIPSFSLLLSGFSLCLMVSGFARGLMWFGLVNVMQLLYVAFFPILLLGMGTSFPLPEMMAAIGCAALLVAVGSYWMLACRRDEAPPAPTILTPRAAAADLLHYGVPRLGTMVVVLLHSLSLPWLVNRGGSSSTLAALNGLLGIISAAALLVAPVGLVMLPHLSKLQAAGAHDRMSAEVSRMLQAALMAGGLGAMGAITFLQPVVTVWLGPEVAGYKLLILACALSIPSYLVMEILRSPVDAVSSRPWNIVPYGMGAVVTISTFLLLSRVGLSAGTAAAGSLVAGMSLTAWGSVRVAGRFFTLRGPEADLRRSLYAGWMLVGILSATFLWLPIWLHVLAGVVTLVGWLLTVVRSAPAWLIDLLPAWGRLFAQRLRT